MLVCPQSNLGYDRVFLKKEFWVFGEVQSFLHQTPINPWKSICLCSSKTQVAQGVWGSLWILLLCQCHSQCPSLPWPSPAFQDGSTHESLHATHCCIRPWKEPQNQSVMLLGEGIKISLIFFLGKRISTTPSWAASVWWGQGWPSPLTFSLFLV